MEKKRRTFIAVKINPDPRTARFLSVLGRELDGEKIRWTSLDDLHITLAFLGPTGEAEIEKVKELLHKLTTNYWPIYTALRGAGVFPSNKNPRVIWLGLEGAETLIKMREELAVALQKAGVEFDSSKRFFPHLTVGRIKWLDNRDDMLAVLSRYENELFQPLEINSMQFYESILKSTATEYKALGEFTFPWRPVW